MQLTGLARRNAERPGSCWETGPSVELEVRVAYAANLLQTLAGVAAAMRRSVKDLLLATN